MVTGDRAAVAAGIADMFGADAVHAEQTPADEVAAVRAETARARTVMVDDGVNDAPVLAAVGVGVGVAAGVGVALGAHGAAASSDTADVVIVVDRLDRLAEILAIALRQTVEARHAIVRLHFAQEDENLFVLADLPGTSSR